MFITYTEAEENINLFLYKNILNNKFLFLNRIKNSIFNINPYC